MTLLTVSTVLLGSSLNLPTAQQLKLTPTQIRGLQDPVAVLRMALVLVSWHLGYDILEVF